MTGFKEEASFTPTTFDEVPWHRKVGSINLFTLLFPVLVLAVFLTGNAYYEKDGKVVAIPGKRRWVHIIAAAYITLMMTLSLIYGKQ